MHNTGKINILIKKQSVQLNNENDSLGLGGNKELKEIKDNSSKESEKLLLMNKKMNGHINFLKQKVKRWIKVFWKNEKFSIILLQVQVHNRSPSIFVFWVATKNKKKGKLQYHL